MKSFMIRMLIRWDIRGYALEEVFPWRRLLHGVSTISGIEGTECVHFQEYHTAPPPYSVCVRNVFRSPAESIPHAYGICGWYKRGLLTKRRTPFRVSTSVEILTQNDNIRGTLSSFVIYVPLYVALRFAISTICRLNVLILCIKLNKTDFCRPICCQKLIFTAFFLAMLLIIIIFAS